MRQNLKTEEVHAISSQYSTLYPTSFSFSGLMSFDDGIRRARRDWREIWRIIGKRREDPEVHFRNPYSPEKQIPFPFPWDTRRNYILDQSIEGREGFETLLSHLEKKRAISRDDSTFWKYSVSGQVFFESREMVGLNLSWPNFFGGLYQPCVAKPLILRLSIDHQIPARYSNQRSKQIFRLKK